MTKSNKFSPEVRERAVRMVQEHRGDYPSLWAAIESIAPKIGCVPQTLNDWVKKAEVDSGQRPGTTKLASFLREEHLIEKRMDACKHYQSNAEIDLRNSTDNWQSYLRKPTSGDSGEGGDDPFPYRPIDA